MKRLKSLAVAGAAALIIGSGAPPASAAIYCEKVSPCVRVTDVTVTESDSAARQVAFEIHLAPAASFPMVVEYRTVDGTARAGSDYSSQSGSRVFEPGEFKKTVLVNVIGDVLEEPNETFFLDVTRANGAQIQDGRGQATIVDNDPSQPGSPPSCPPSLPNCHEP